MESFKTILCIVLIHAACVQYAQSGCSKETTEKINKLWNGKPPSNLLPWMDGTWTFIKISTKHTGVNAELTCFQQVVNSAQASAKVNMHYSDPTKDTSLDMKLEEKPGTIVEKYKVNNKDQQDSQSVLYIHQGVMAFIYCNEDGGEISGIRVKEYSKFKDDPKTKEAIQQAEEALKKVAAVLPQGIHTECPVVKKTK